MKSKPCTLFLDIETTGLDPNNNSVLEIAAELWSGDPKPKKISAFHLNIKPNFEKDISLGALRVNKREVAVPYNYLEEEKEVAKRFVDWLISISEHQMIVCGVNVHFDVQFLEAMLKRYNFYDLKSIISHRHYDITSIVRYLQATNKLNISDSITGGTLEKLAKHFKIDCSKLTLHTAKGDVTLTRKVLHKLETL